MKVRSAVGLRSRAALLGCVLLVVPGTPSGAGAAARPLTPSPAPPQELSYTLAFSRRRPIVGESPAAARAGGMVALAVRRPGRAVPADAPFTDDGTPTTVIGSQLLLMSTAAGTDEIDVCPPRSDCWHPVWSPDATLLAFYSNAGGGPAPWVYEAGRGSRQLADVRIRTTLYGGDEPSWSADGRTLFIPVATGGPAPEARESPDAEGGATVRVYAYPSRAAGPGVDPIAAADERLLRAGAAAIAAVDVPSGDVRLLVPQSGERPPSVLRLSPSGSWVSYLTVQRLDPQAQWGEARRDLEVVPAGGGASRVVARDLVTGFDPYRLRYRDSYRWHPAQDRVAWVEDGSLRTLDLRADGDGAAQTLGASLGAVLDRPLLFTADGSAVIVGLEPRHGRSPDDVTVDALAVVPLDGSTAIRLDLPAGLWFQELVSGDARTAWTTAEGDLLVVMDDRSTGETVAVAVDPGTGESRELLRRRARWSGVRAAGGSLAAIYEDLQTPPDAYLLDATLRPTRRLSSLEPSLDAVVKTRARTLSVAVSSPAGETVQVHPVLLSASSAAAAPALVLLYPGADLGRFLSYYGGGAPITIPTLLFTSRGFDVLLVDIPMRDFGAAAEPADEMTAALLPQVQAAIDAGWVDGDRLAVAGQSYGGYSTAAVITRTDRFRAAVAISGIYDLFGSYGRLDEDGRNRWQPWLEHGQGRMGADPWAAPQRYLDNSPYYQADRIHTPLLLIHGDQEAAYVDAGKLFSALRRLGREVELASYAGEGHVVSDWSVANAVDAARRMLEFLRGHLTERSRS